MKRTYLVLIITMLVIGFAALTTSLVINGTINFGFNENNFDDGVIFTHTNTYNGEATISENKKTINFNTKKLEYINDEAILDFYITNKSIQYDATVSVNCTFEPARESYEQYIKIEQDLANSFDLNSGETRKGRVEITLIKTYTDELDQVINMTCNLEATPKGRTSEGIYTPVEPEYEEILLQGADPVLEGTEATSNKKLIPVEISDGGVVTRADTTKEWYDYETKKWANAVILNDGVVDPGPEKEILESQIESYFVWIPKYKYKLWNVDTDHPTHTGPFAIEVEFGTEDTENNDNECIAPNESGKTNECANGRWMTHPAFTSFGVNGFWVGKFEVGYKGATSKTDAEKDEQNSKKVIVKPNVYSWRGITIKNMFNSLKGYATNLDSHMMKNTEWGAVAYLSHSKYGINTSVAQNPEPNYKTGYGETSDSVVSYPSSDVFIASTTGNITGVYDMSGGAWERVAAYSDMESTTEQIGSGGFTKQDIIKIGEKYFDVYDSTSINTSYNKRILGDATGELGPFNEFKGSWYQDMANFVGAALPWFHRGGSHRDSSSGVGQFKFTRFYGSADYDNCSRLILSPK